MAELRRCRLNIDYDTASFHASIEDHLEDALAFDISACEMISINANRSQRHHSLSHQQLNSSNDIRRPEALKHMLN